MRRLSGGRFYVSTRRGKQFNSMVQRDVDPLTGASRDAVLMHPGDAERLGLQRSDRAGIRGLGRSDTARQDHARLGAVGCATSGRRRYIGCSGSSSKGVSMLNL